MRGHIGAIACAMRRGGRGRTDLALAKWVNLENSTVRELLRTEAFAKLAEREGFEPSIRFCRILTFQASAFDHSATAPHALEEAASSKTERQGQARRRARRSFWRAPRPSRSGRRHHEW